MSVVWRRYTQDFLRRFDADSKSDRLLLRNELRIATVLVDRMRLLRGVKREGI